MNYKLVANLFGKTFIICSLFFIAPLIVALIYGENTYAAFFIPAEGLFVLGVILQLFKSKNNLIAPKEAFVIVALTWIVLCVVNAVPFVISGEISNFTDALFETVSGLTTTGASALDNVENLSKSIGFWRIFNHFIGGMGVLVFLLAIIPGDNASAIHVLRAESPGPTSQKFVSKIRFTARILYTIYIALTVIMIILLLCGGLNVYDAVVHSLSTAGTGGFSTKNASIAAFNSTFVEMVVAVFMFLFGINFNVFYLILIGKFARAFSGEELRIYFTIIVAATLIIAINLLETAGGFANALRLSFFQTAAISSTTGFSTADINTFPELSQGILLVLMVIGGCGGSTAGGIKVARLAILTKSSATDLRRMMSPRSVITTKFEKEPVESSTINAVRVYFTLWVAILITATLILSIDSVGSFTEDFTGALTCIGNVGPRLGSGYFGGYSAVSKIALSLTMLAGRLEIFPLFILFNYKTWKK